MPRSPEPSHAVVRLIAELEAGRVDSALTRHLIGDRKPFPRLLRACFLAEQGRLAQARADVDAALAWAPSNPIVELVAGLLLFVTRDYQRALTRFEGLFDGPPGPARRATHAAIKTTIALGWDHDTLDYLRAAIARDPGYPSWHARAAAAHSRGDWPEQALADAVRGLELSPEQPSLWMEAASLHAAVGRLEPALEAIEQALARAPVEQRGPFLREAVRVALDVGAWDRARAWLDDALALAADDPALRVIAAELHEWAGDDERVRVEVEAALREHPGHGPALRLLGALELRAGVADRARVALDQAIAAAPNDYQAWIWLAELELRAGHYERAHACLDVAVSRSGESLVIVSMLRYLVVAYDEHDLHGELVAASRTDEFEGALLELAPELAVRALETRDRADMLAAVEAALAARRGNRSARATHVVEGRLVRLRSQAGSRHESRRALQRLRVAPPEVCLRAFDALEGRYPDSSLPICHRGELRLWLGDWDGARRDFEAAIDRVLGTRWAYMGLSTLDLLAGDPERCLATNARGVEVMRGTEGLAIHGFRGEALRKLGRLDAAIVELDRAVTAHPARASAVINLTLALFAVGDHERGRELWRRLANEQACGLISDAARELSLGISLAAEASFGPPSTIAALPEAAALVSDNTDELPSPTLIRAVLERALAMMGGNRSSGLLSYWTRVEAHGPARLRFVQPWPHSDPSPHTRDAIQIAQAKQLLLAALGSVKDRARTRTASPGDR